MIRLKKETIHRPDLAKPRKKLGDMVETVAQPIAKGIDAVLGTKVQECGGCPDRKIFLNKIDDAVTAKAKEIKEKLLG